MGGCEGQRGDRDPQESGENGGGRETRVCSPSPSIYLFLPLSVSSAQMCQGKAEEAK